MASTMTSCSMMKATPLRTHTSTAGRVRPRFVVSAKLIGEVNNPEKTRKNAEKKHSEGQWATPGENKNPLEKHTMMREDFTEQGGDLKDEVNSGVQNIVSAAGDKVEEAKEKFQELTGKGQSNAKDTARKAEKEGKGVFGDVKEKVQEAADNVGDAVKKATGGSK